MASIISYLPSLGVRGCLGQGSGRYDDDAVDRWNRRVTVSVFIALALAVSVHRRMTPQTNETVTSLSLSFCSRLGGK